MTSQNSNIFLQEDITTEDAFDTALNELIVAALQNGIDPKGSWICRNDETVPDTEIMVYELKNGDN